jgi:hypothetical protein
MEVENGEGEGVLQKEIGRESDQATSAGCARRMVQNHEEDRNAGRARQACREKYGVQAVRKPLLESTIPFVTGL